MKILKYNKINVKTKINKTNICRAKKYQNDDVSKKFRILWLGYVPCTYVVCTIQSWTHIWWYVKCVWTMSKAIYFKIYYIIYILRYEQTQQGYQFWIYDFIFCFYADNTFSFPNVNNILCVYECIFILFYQKHPYSAMGNSWAVSYVWKCFSAFFFFSRYQMFTFFP